MADDGFTYVGVRLSPEDAARLRYLAEHPVRTWSDVIRQAIRDAAAAIGFQPLPALPEQGVSPEVPDDGNNL